MEDENKYVLPVFGDIEPDKHPEIEPHFLDGFYSGTIELFGEKVEINLHLDLNFVNDVALNFAKMAIKNMEEYVKIAHHTILNNFKVRKRVRDYFNIHVSALGKSYINELIKGCDKTLSFEEQLLSIVELHRIGICPNGDGGENENENENENYIFFDYRLGKALIHHVLVVKISEDKSILGIGIES